MSPRLWLVIIGAFVVCNLIESIALGPSAGLFGIDAASDLQDGVTVSEVTVGEGIFGQMALAARFFTHFLPRLFTWNFSFLSGSMDVVQAILIFITSSLFILTFGQAAAGTVSRLIGGRL